MKKQYLITGTDTNCGKTLVTCALLQKANEINLHAIGLKPLAAGAELISGQQCNDDAIQIQKYASVKLSYQQTNPVLLAEAASPHIAANIEGKKVSVQKLVGFSRGALMNKHDLALIEGAGGWHVPINTVEKMSDFARAMELPIILVVGLRLGCLNHALLTAESIFRSGLKIAAWVPTQIEKDMHFVEENLTTLEKMFPFPKLGFIPYQSDITVDYAASKLDINKLIESL